MVSAATGMLPVQHRRCHIMIDIEKQITYWSTGAEEDWAVAKNLIADESIRHALFFAHLTLEKILKAYVCHYTKNLAPRIHNLARLVELSDLTLRVNYADILREMNAFNLEGRYPEFVSGLPTLAEAHEYMTKTEEVYQWLAEELKIQLST